MATALVTAAEPAAATPAPSVTPPRLDQVDALFMTAVRAEVGSAEQAYDLAVGEQNNAEGIASAEADRADALGAQLRGLAAGQQHLAANVAYAHDRLRDFAVAAYVTGGVGTPMSAMLGSGTIGDYSRRRALYTAFLREGRDQVRTYAQARREAATETVVTVDQWEAARAQSALSSRAAAAAADRVERAAELVASRRRLLMLASNALSVPGTDIPAMVLDAYQRAALFARARGCRIAWWGIAGIGKIETDHGRLQGGSLEANGDVVPPIVGAPLDGTGGTIATPAPGAPPTGPWDHAIGPMQFITSTWKRWGADGDGDGNADPNNIYDAARTTALYLCAASKDLLTPSGLRTAYFSYNHSDDYVSAALEYAAGYQAVDAGGGVPPLAPVPLYAQAS